MAENTPSPVRPGRPGRPTEPISTARKVRLLLLCALLLGLMMAAGVLALKEHRRERDRQRQVAQELDDMRQSLGKLDLVAVETHWNKIKAIDPENVEADRLLVPYYLAGGQMDRALGQFNTLVDAGSVQAPTEPPATDPGLASVLTRLQPGRLRMGKGDERYVTDESLLEGLAQRITHGAASDRERALRLCRWFALHVEPTDPYSMPVDPYVVVWRWFGSPQQSAWAYAEMARQVGLACAVVVPATGEAQLVQVYPSGSEPFLVDPGLGVPVLDPSSGKLLSMASPSLEKGYAALLALGGEKAGDPGRVLKGATLEWAIAPSALIPRFAAFDRLCAPLLGRPHLAFRPGPLPDGSPAGLWRVPFQTVDAYIDPARTADFEKAHAWLSKIGKLSDLLLQQPDPQADAVLVGAVGQIKKLMDMPASEEAKAMLRDEMEALTFWRGANAHDAGEHAKALELLKAYADAYPKGRWSAVAAALRADAMAQSGQADAAKAAWGEMPPERRLYGAMRAAGLLPVGRPAASGAP